MSEQKLIFSGCWNCGELRTKLKGVSRNQHRHCPKCDFMMDYDYHANFKVCWEGYKCSKCGLIIGCGTMGTEYGLNQVYGYGWTIPDVINRTFLRAQKQRCEGQAVTGIN